MDYSEMSHYKNSPMKTLANKINNAISGVVKFQCGGDYCNKDCPYPVYPFHYPGPNDFKLLPPDRKTNSRHRDVFNEVTYKSEYADIFLKCYHTDSFASSIFARWGIPDKKYRNRVPYTEMATEHIKDSNIVAHSFSKSVSMEEYFSMLCRSKFAGMLSAPRHVYLLMKPAR